jgi:integrase
LVQIHVAGRGYSRIHETGQSKYCPQHGIRAQDGFGQWPGGIRSKKPIPTLKEFCTSRFEPWAKSIFEKNALNNWLWFRGGMRALLLYRPMANAKLDKVTNELAAEFASYRQSAGKQVSTVNSSLRVLRRILGLAAEWGVLETRPTISLISGERHRDTVVSAREQRLYLEHAPEPLKSIATILVETGIRPDECYRLRWEDLHWSSFENPPSA